MNRYKFVKYPVKREGFQTFGDPTKVILNTEAVSLNELIENFENFLKASGFQLPEGAHLGFEYDEEENSPPVFVDAWGRSITHRVVNLHDSEKKVQGL